MMVKACSGFNCKSRDTEESRRNGISFHIFPKNEQLRREWALATKREGKTKGSVWEPPKFSYLCSKHFVEKDFEVLQQRKILRENTVPSIFDFPVNVKPQQNIQLVFPEICKPRKENALIPDIIVDHGYCTPTDKICHLKKKKWLSNISLKPSKRKAKSLCSDHFTNEAFSDTSRRRLHSTAVPTIQYPIKVIKETDKLISVNQSIGLHGGTYILLKSEGPITVLTHCNRRNFATAENGAALAVIHWLHQQKKLSHLYFTENPFYKKGGQLTPHELVHDDIPATLICESMVSALLNTKKVTAVVVSADRVAANGDTANKIGTYHIAISAQYHGVPFYVASSISTLDLTLENGSLIPVEEQPHSEMTTNNLQRISPCGINWWNPAFDITPAELITGGIITEHGVFPVRSLKKLEESFKDL